jgi:O-antigen ligase
MQTSMTRSRFAEVALLAAGLFAIAAASGFVAWATKPLFVPLIVAALLGGVVLVMRPELGVFLMFALVLFKPEATQDLGLLSPMRLIAAALAGILVLTVVLGGRADFLKSNEVRLYLLLGVLLIINWYFVGQMQAPGSLADRDQTARTLSRYVTHFTFLIFIIAFVRTRAQILLLTALFLVGVVVTIPSALQAASSAATVTTKVDAMRAAASAGLQTADNANRLAFVCLMGVSYIWFALQQYRWLLLRLVGLGTMLVLVLTIFKAGSRSGVLNLLVLGLLLLLQSRLKPGHIGLILVVVLITAGLVAAFVPDAVMQRLATIVVPPDDAQPKSLAESNVRRLTILGAGLKLAAENPLMGIGIGNFRWVTLLDGAYGGISMAAHNAYLLALAEGGIVLLGGYLLLFAITARDLSRALRQSAEMPEVGLRWLILATRTNLALLLVFSLFAEAWKEFFILLILGTTGVLAHIYGRAAAGGGAASSASPIPATRPA